MHRPSIVYNDNSACIQWLENMTTKGLQHIQIRENAIRELAQENFVLLKHVDGKSFISRKNVMWNILFRICYFQLQVKLWYGLIPKSCHDVPGASYDIQVCNIDSIVHDLSENDGWLFTITGDINVKATLLDADQKSIAKVDVFLLLTGKVRKIE